MADISTSSVIMYTQHSTPTAYSSYLNSGPSGISYGFGCSPSPSAMEASTTLLWHATGDGCPGGYLYSSGGSGNTCIYTSTQSTRFSMTWECVITVTATTTSSIDGGTTTLSSGQAATKTGRTQYVTVTETTRMPTTLTSTMIEKPKVTVAASAKHAAQKREVEEMVKPGPKYLLPRDMFQCPQNDYWCTKGSACIGDAFSKSCCVKSLVCIDFDPASPFAANEYVALHTWTSTATETTTTYKTANSPSDTVTVTATSTRTFTSTVIDVALATDLSRSDTNSSTVRNPASTPPPTTNFDSAAEGKQKSVKIGASIGISLGLAFVFGLIYLINRHSKASRAEAAQRNRAPPQFDPAHGRGYEHSSPMIDGVPIYEAEALEKSSGMAGPGVRAVHVPVPVGQEYSPVSPQQGFHYVGYRGVGGVRGHGDNRMQMDRVVHQRRESGNSVNF